MEVDIAGATFGRAIGNIRRAAAGDGPEPTKSSQRRDASSPLLLGSTSTIRSSPSSQNSIARDCRRRRCGPRRAAMTPSPKPRPRTTGSSHSHASWPASTSSATPWRRRRKSGRSRRSRGTRRRHVPLQATAAVIRRRCSRPRPTRLKSRRIATPSRWLRLPGSRMTMQREDDPDFWKPVPKLTPEELIAAWRDMVEDTKDLYGHLRRIDEE